MPFLLYFRENSLSLCLPHLSDFFFFFFFSFLFCFVYPNDRPVGNCVLRVNILLTTYGMGWDGEGSIQRIYGWNKTLKLSWRLQDFVSIYLDSTSICMQFPILTPFVVLCTKPRNAWLLYWPLPPSFVMKYCQFEKKKKKKKNWNFQKTNKPQNPLVSTKIQ